MNNGDETAKEVKRLHVASLQYCNMNKFSRAFYSLFEEGTFQLQTQYTAQIRPHIISKNNLHFLGICYEFGKNRTN